MEENTVAIDVTRVRFPADAYVIDIADAGEQKTQQGEIKLKHLLVQMTPVPYPLGHGASWLMSARQGPSWLTPARQVMLLQLLARAWHHCCHCFCAQNQQRQARGLEPLRAEPNGFRIHLLAARTHCHALVRMRWLAIYYFRHWGGPNDPGRRFSACTCERENTKLQLVLPGSP